uniref:Secreted protein n=1 Tax=Schistosoma mansoni TaxID=6183 RepID=A0A5K4F7Z2_SCHMA
MTLQKMILLVQLFVMLHLILLITVYAELTQTETPLWKKLWDEFGNILWAIVLGQLRNRHKKKTQTVQNKNIVDKHTNSPCES